MCLLFETIRMEPDGTIPLLPWHQARMDRARMDLFGRADTLSLSGILLFPDSLQGKVIRCRVNYDRELVGVQYEEYIPRIIRSLSLVKANDLSYAHKFADRHRLDELRRTVGTDEVIMVRNGFVTDASTANLVFSRGSDLLTPLTPMLYGTRRQSLLDAGYIREEEIRAHDLDDFTEVFLINALRKLESPLPLHAIIH